EEGTLADSRSRALSRIEHQTEQRDLDQRALDELDPAVLDSAREIYPRLRERQQRSGSAKAASSRGAESADEAHRQEQRLADAIDSETDRTQRELNGYTTSIQHAMAEIRRRWPEQTTEMDASVEARAEYVRFHERVAGD